MSKDSYAVTYVQFRDPVQVGVRYLDCWDSVKNKDTTCQRDGSFIVMTSSEFRATVPVSNVKYILEKRS
jgi:hypothetical protein